MMDSPFPFEDPLMWYKRKFICMKSYATEIIQTIAELPLESLVHKELQYVKFVLAFTLSLKCIFGHDTKVTKESLAKVDTFTIIVLDIQVRLAFLLIDTEKSLNEARTTDLGKIQRHAQRVLDNILEVLHKWPQETVPEEPQRRQFCIDLLYKTLQTRCAMTHFYIKDLDSREHTNLYAQVVLKLNEVLTA